ncbi:Coiled-coil domain-containing protein 172 [Apodemus speciosus]|uniref:Coiled-coil domain-containing protein 172 n=1 Tax=Apodemus speciosus TaxID=105296 RepID=A0ABQ0FTI8_APOSI
MSLESLFQHIIFTEHQAEESRRVLREVRSEITRYENSPKLEVQQFSEKSFLLELLKTHKNALERQRSEIISERDTLLQACEAIKKKTTDEEERFIKEITDFNDNYEITKKRDTSMKENIKMEIADLENQADVLRGDLQEMKSMECNSGQLQELQKLKSELLQELFTLQKKLKVLKDEETEAICITKHLEAEKIRIRDKPQHDPECTRNPAALDRQDWPIQAPQHFSDDVDFGVANSNPCIWALVAAVLINPPALPYLHDQSKLSSTAPDRPPSATTSKRGPQWPGRRLGVCEFFVHQRDNKRKEERQDRLKRELDLYKAEDMESVCRALQAEVDLLESSTGSKRILRTITPRANEPPTLEHLKQT